MKIVTASQMRELDRRAETEYGVPSLILMENAGLRVVEVVENLLEKVEGRKVLVAAGKGNNGGDGLVVARHLLNAGAVVKIFLLGDPSGMTPDARINYDILVKMKADIKYLKEEKDLESLAIEALTSDLIIDALYGISFRGSLNDFDSRVVRIINWAKKPVVAIDIPSGVEADSGRVKGEAVRANWTVTMALPKRGLFVEPGCDYVGTLSVADISIPGTLLKDSSLQDNLLTEEWVAEKFVPRKRESHKGSYGHVLVIGGSVGLTGAVILTSSAALAAGAGLVTAAIPESLLPIVENKVVEVMTVPLAETRQKSIALEALPAIENLLGTVSVCAIGPGMSRYPEASAVLRLVLEKSGVPVIIDADGLNALAQDINMVKGRQIPIVLTPHPGEMARLLGTTVEEVQARRLEVARQAALEWGVTVVLKGSRTIIAEPSGDTYLNLTGNPGMATAGSGDVLTGIIAGLMAQGMRPDVAACVGVYVHGKAGDKAKEKTGEMALVAGDLIKALPEVLKKFET